MKRIFLALAVLVAVGGSASGQPGGPGDGPVPLPLPQPRWNQGNWRVDPRDLVEAGQDLDGKTVFAAVGELNGRLIPGKSKAPFSTCWVGFGGAEHTVNRFELVSGPGLHWVDYSSTRPVPAEALTVGPDQDGTPVYIARGEYMGRWVAGKYRAGAMTCLVPFAGRERDCYRFQLLLRD